MEKLKTYFKNIGIRRFIAMIIGNIILGLGISIFKFAGMGNDPYTAMIFGVSDFFEFYFPTFQIAFNFAVFVIFELTLGRKYIGVGTIVNMFFLGYIVNFFVELLYGTFNAPITFLQQLPVMIIGVLVTCFGVSFYQTSDAGVSPYDSVSIIMSDRIKWLPYFWARIFTDALSTLVCFLTGGLLGLGTLVCAFGIGPLVTLYNKYVSEPVILGKKSNMNS
ncbi:MAG: hypothetical protein Q4D29_07250 [Lachnospiraceae bacterium]|nr:hypothetical protein [Lachnospiraceae bacterium]